MGGLIVPGTGAFGAVGSMGSNVPHAGIPMPPGALPPVTGSRTGQPVVSTGARTAAPATPRPRTWLAPVLTLAALGVMGGGAWAALRAHRAAPAAVTTATQPTNAPTAAAVVAPPPNAPAIATVVMAPAAPSASTTANAPAASGAPVEHAPTTPVFPAAAVGQNRRRPSQPPTREAPRPTYVPPASSPAPANTIGF
jgi:hypothetical protein